MKMKRQPGFFFCTWKKYFLSHGQPELCKKFSEEKIKLMVDHMFLR